VSRNSNKKILLLGAASVVSLMLADFTTSIALAQSALPPVIVDAPQAAPRRAAQSNRSSSTRRAAARRAAPVAAAAPAAGYAAPSTSTMGAPKPYAGGQVATGGQLGLLGNRGVMDTPFSQVNYTDKLIKDQQARTVVDVLYNNPSIRTTWADNSYTSALMIRGFAVSPWDFSFNGLFGVVPGLSFAADSVDRVEVLNGPSAFLNGLPPLGSVGGTINIVPKRATDDPITRITGLYSSNSTFGTQIDVGRRYGEKKEWGVRFNGSYRNGDTSTSNQSIELGNAAVGLDYRGERFRTSLDLGYQDQNTQSPLRPTYLAAGVAVPRAPGADANWFQPWTYAHVQDIYGAWRGEYDLTNNFTVYAAVGGRRNRDYLLTGFATINNANGNLVEAPYNFPVFRDDSSQEVGIRGRFSTGFIDHRVSLAGTRLDDWSGSQFPVVATINSNLYNPTFIAAPSYARIDPKLSSVLHASTGAVSDTMSVLDDRVQLTLGGRQQRIQSAGFSTATGAQTSYYAKDAFTPAVALLVKPLQNVSLYVNYIEGLQPGLTVPIGYANYGQVLAPYVSKQVETGVKVDWGRVITTAAFFEITQPAALAATTSGPYTQDGLQRNRGLELNAAGEVTDSVRVLGGVTFLEGRLVRTANGVNDGHTAPGVPDIQLNIGGEWDTPFLRGLTLTGRAIYTSEQYYDAANLQQIPDWVRFDLGARYVFDLRGKPVTVRANVINVANTGYWAAATPTYGLVLGAPRTYMISTTFDF
jgi:iron complex outermembrane receptor protein